MTELPAGSTTNPVVYSNATGSYGFSSPWGVAADASGNVWIANQTGNSVTELR